MYSFDSRVRYSEIDENRDLTVTAMINYLQDCSTFHSEDIGKGLDYLEERKRVWLMSFWQIVIDRMPKFGEKIRICAHPYGINGLYGMRNFRILNEKDECLVVANSVWVMYDLEKNRPARITERDVDGYGMSPEEKQEMDYAPRKVPIPDTWTESAPVAVASHHIDTNHHVNNAKYVEIAREALPEKIRIRELRVEYKKSAVMGDVIIPRVTRQDDICTVVLAGPENEIYAVVWMKTE